MTRRRFYSPSIAFDFDEKTVILSVEETRHARNVLRLRPGDEVYVFDGLGKELRCVVREFARDGAVLDVKEAVAPAGAESPLDLTLAIALLKGEKFDLVIQKTVELGVKRIVPLQTERTDVRLPNNDDAQKRVTRWQRIALEAAKQSGRAYVPEIARPVTVDSFLRSVPDKSVKLFFAERDGKSLSDAMESFAEAVSHVVAVVGPEGGWSDAEIALARQNDWSIVTLGGRVLRAETAAIAIVSLLQHRFGDLN